MIKGRSYHHHVRVTAPSTAGFSASGVELFGPPPRAVLHVQGAFVQAIRSAVPELHAIGKQAEAAPERRTRDWLPVESALDLAVAFVQGRARREHVALVG